MLLGNTKGNSHVGKICNLFPLNTQYQIGIYSLHSNVETYHSVKKLPIDNYMKALIEKKIRIVRENNFLKKSNKERISIFDVKTYHKV